MLFEKNFRAAHLSHDDQLAAGCNCGVLLWGREGRVWFEKRGGKMRVGGGLKALLVWPNSLSCAPPFDPERGGGWERRDRPSFAAAQGKKYFKREDGVKKEKLRRGRVRRVCVERANV